MFQLSFEQLLPSVYYYLAVSLCLYFMSYFIEVVLNLPSSSCINTNYVELKRFINRICHEVINITDNIEFTETSSTAVPKASFDPQTYEELLATAVINKITSDYLHRKKYGMSSEIVAERDSEITETTEDDEFNFYDKMHLDKIQGHKISLPDLLNEFDTLDDDASNENKSGVWEDNWSMKKYGNADQKISMLIPSPAFDIKAKIGDKDVDELSDSTNKDTNSENLDELYEEEFAAFENEMIEGETEQAPEPTSLDKISRESNVIKSTSQLDVEDGEVNDELFNNISGLSSSLNRKYIDEVFEQILMTNKNEGSASEKKANAEKALEKDCQVNEDKSTERVIEESYLKYKSPLLTQYLIKPIQPIKVADAMRNASQSIIDETQNISATEADEKVVEKPLTLTIKEQANLEELGVEENEVNTPPIKGSIAEREHLKWLKAIPIENEKNYPYSPENLHKRLSRSHEKYIDVHSDKILEQDPPSEFDDIQLREDITKYKRDYYINNSSLSNESANHKPKEQSNENSSIEADYSGDHPIDSSLTDDSLTRVYTLSSRETTILLPSSNVSIQLSKDNDEKETSHDKNEDNIPLPSVKKLAQLYASPTSASDDSNAKHQEPMDIPAGISKLTSKRYELSDIPAKPIASITARTLPPKIKEDLKKSLHPNDDMTIIRHNERNVSPDIQRGLTKSSIAYFENL